MKTSESIETEPISLGEFLSRRRKELNLSVHEVAERLHTTDDVVRAFEENQYESFSARVYAVSFFKKILTTLGVVETPDIFGAFNDFWQHAHGKKHEVSLAPAGGAAWRTRFVSLRLGLGVGGIFLAVVFLFFIARASSFLTLPQLSIDAPAQDIIISRPTIRVAGTAERESQLTVNGREIMLNAEGSFDEYIDMQPGLTALEFLVTDRFGKKQSEVRYVLVR